MALTPTLELRVDNGSYYFIDTTGLYDADVNDGGWGAPNLARSAVTRVKVVITNPDGTSSTFDTDDSTLTLAKITGAGATYWNVIFHKASLTFIDGQYQISYIIYDGATEYEYSDTWFYLEDVKCCIFKQMALLVRTGKCTKIDETKDVLANWSIYKAIQFSAAGGTVAEAEYMLEKLQKWCNNTC